MKKKIIVILVIIFITILILTIVNIAINKLLDMSAINKNSDISTIILGNTQKSEVDASKKEKIIDYTYSVYFYDIEDVEFEYIGNKINLKEALKNKEIHIEQIIEQAEEDAKLGKVYSATAHDGGSKIYKYDSFSILKMHSADGNRDVYIGKKNMGMSAVE